MAKVVTVWITAPSGAVARRLARLCVAQRWAACVQIIPRIQSVYRWKGKVEEALEDVLMIKTTTTLAPALMRGVRAAHPYEVPEILVFSAVSGCDRYLKWVCQSVRK